MSDDAPLGTFEEQVMLAVVHAGADAFGMGVRREIESRTGRDVAIGAVYATLDRLEAKRLISSVRSKNAGQSRRVFRITSTGSRALTATRAMRDTLWRGIDPARLV
jgi:PadR family transcriptional regulator PadR